MIKYFYGVEFVGDVRSKTEGEPNSRTGIMSKAIKYRAFFTKADRDLWVKNSGDSMAASVKTIRSLQLGQSVLEFADNLQSVQSAAFAYERIPKDSE